MAGLFERLKRSLRYPGKHQGGFTALQTMIGMFAALATAGTVSTMVVSSSDDASQQVDQAIHDTINNIQGTFMIKGSAYGKTIDAGQKGSIGQITLNVALVCDDGFIDFTPPTAALENSGLAGPDSANLIVISYTDEHQRVDDLYWTVIPLGKDDGDLMLEGDEVFQITIGGSPTSGQDGGNLVDALEPNLSGDTAFNIEMGAPQGALVYFEGHTPSYLKKVNCFQ